MASIPPLLLLLTTHTGYSHQGHQERANRLVPGFQPYDHPAQKAVGGPPSRLAGPMGQVEWVEGRGHGEGGVPVFGAIEPPPPSATSSSPLLLLLLLGGLAAAALLKAKTASTSTPTKKEEKERRGREEEQRHPCPPSVWQPRETKQHTPPPCKAASRKVTESNQKEEEDESKLVNNLMNHVEAELRAETVEEQTQTKNLVPTITITEVVQATTQAAENEETKQEIITPKITETEHIKEIAEVTKPEEPIIKEKQVKEEAAKIQPKKAMEDFSINATTEDTVEEPEYITKIKTFKITKWPKFNSANIVQHGPDSLLSVLLPLQLQKCDEWKCEVRTTTADLSIEGANMSRLLITVVTEQGEEESLSKTMTIKEYMVSISNKIIEEAVAAVRQDCSSDNIRRLAETIRKYRPESAEVKNVRKL